MPRTKVVRAEAPPPPADTLLDEMAAEAEALTAAPLPPDLLARIVAHAQDLKDLRVKITEQEAVLASLQEQEQRLVQQTLPTIMDEAGVATLTLEDGSTVLREEAVYASLSKEHAPAVCQWLIKSGYPDIIKTAFSIHVPRGKVAEALRINKLLTKAKIAFEYTQSVHPQTLLAFVKESLRESRALSPLISYHVQPQVKLQDKPKSRSLKPIR